VVSYTKKRKRGGVHTRSPQKGEEGRIGGEEGGVLPSQKRKRRDLRGEQFLKKKRWGEERGMTGNSLSFMGKKKGKKKGEREGKVR